MQNFDLAHILRQHTEGATIDVANDTVAVTRTLLSQSADTIDCFISDSKSDAKVIAALREALVRVRNSVPGRSIIGSIVRDALAASEQTAGEIK